MTTKAHPTLAYCLNVFGGQSHADLCLNLRGQVRRLKDSFCPDGPFAVEMHIGEQLALELTQDEGKLQSLKATLSELDLRVVAVNAFPISDFHGETVKSDVFTPTWLEERRVLTTCLAGKILAELVPGETASVSTSPGTYRGFGVDENTLQTVARNMARVAAAYAEIEWKTGKRIVLSIEPEPWGMIETVDEAVSFFDLLLEAGGGIIRSCEGGDLVEDSSAALRRYVGVNIDLCHQSVMFEDHGAGYRQLTANGISIPKVHVSSAVSLSNPADEPKGLELLQVLGADRYLHQVMGLDRNGVVRRVAADLPLMTTMSREKLSEFVQIRAHVHVPLHLGGVDGCTTTIGETARALGLILDQELSDILVVETYTWEHVLAHLPELRMTPDVVQGMAGELGWLAGTVRSFLEP